MTVWRRIFQNLRDGPATERAVPIGDAATLALAAQLDGMARARLGRSLAIRHVDAGSCNGCELDLARELGAQQVAYGWVQKVSNLILNVNLVFEDATTGQVLRAGSVDIRGNTDESWTRGLRYLIAEQLFRTD